MYATESNHSYINTVIIMYIATYVIYSPIIQFYKQINDVNSNALPLAGASSIARQY